MMRLAALAFLVASAAQAVEPEEFYVKQASWPASMTATRQKMATAAFKDVKLTPWFVSEPLAAASVDEKLPPEDEVDLREKGSHRKKAWRQERWEDINYHGLPNRPGTAVYLFREIHAGTASSEEIRLGCDRPAVIWLNGQVVHRSPGNDRCTLGQESFRVDLKQGENSLLMKVYSEKGNGAFAFDLPASRMDRAVLYELLYRKFWDDFAETDWFLQDNPLRKPGAEDFDARRDFGWYFETPRDTSGEQRMIRRVLEELPGGGPLAERLAGLIKAHPPADDPAWLTLYADACRVRRIERLRPLMQKAPKFVFLKHYTMGGSHYAYTEGQSDAQAERNFRPDTALCLAEWTGSRIRVQTLLSDPHGVIRDPDVSYDGRRIVFAWKKSDREDDYHLYEMDVPTRAVRQITSGPGVADYEPAYLPDGDVLFNSTRCVQTVDCWWTEVSNLYRCDPQGRYLRRLCFDQVHDNYPTVTDDGRILYTRWEYNDRGQVFPQPLWQMNPDGTNQSAYYGLNSWFPTTILHARGVPGTRKAIAIATGHHSRQTGKLILIDPAKGRDEAAGVTLVAPVRDTPSVKIDAFGQSGDLFQYPYPLSETEYLVTYHPVGWRWTTGVGPRFGVYFMTIDGRRERLADDPELPCSQSVPLVARPVPHLRPTLVDYRKHESTGYVQDVYAGPGLEGVARGTIKTLRVVSIDFRAAGVGSNGNGGPGGGAMVSTPVAIGNGTWDPKLILGDAKVFDDGSAFFRVPARTPVFFQLLDEKNRLVQTMRSWVTLQPGENASCVGCHEQKNSVPLARLPVTQAVKAGAEDLRPFYGPTRGFSFRREIQPILDRKCVSCHNGQPDKSFSLADRDVPDARAKRRWSESYLALTQAHADDPANRSGFRGSDQNSYISWVSAQSAPPMQPPYAAGSNRSKMMDLLDKGHEKVQLTREEFDKLAAWIDLGVPFCGDYVESNAWTPEEMEKYQRYYQKRLRLSEEEKASIDAAPPAGPVAKAGK